LLAQISSSRPGDLDKKIRQVAQRLRDMASYQGHQNRQASLLCSILSVCQVISGHTKPGGSPGDGPAW
jgi:hypothetical protein